MLRRRLALDLREGLDGFVRLDEPHLARGFEPVGVRDVVPREVDAAGEDVMPQPTCRRGVLRRPEVRHRLTALAHVPELCSHQVAEDAPAWRVGITPTSVTPAARIRPPGILVSKGKDAAAAHDAAVFPRTVDSVRRTERPETRRELFGGGAALERGHLGRII